MAIHINATIMANEQIASAPPTPPTPPPPQFNIKFAAYVLTYLCNYSAF